MTVSVMLLVSAAAAAVAAAVVYAAMRGRLARAEAAAAVGAARLEAKDAELNAERKRIDDMRRHYEDVRAQAEAQFSALAQKVLDERSAKLKAEGVEQLQGVVAPLLKDMRTFREKIDASDVAAARNAGELKGQIASLVSQTNAVSAQANNLADAIRGDARLVGEWGEVQLKRVLESSGLQENIHYTYQETFRDEDTGRRSKRTDVVVGLPGERSLVIDSKMTLDAALDWHAAADEEARRAAYERLLASVRRHVDEIVGADYAAVAPNAFPVVLMYIPLEEVYMAAIKGQVRIDGRMEPLREYAARKNVTFVNSASLIPVMRLIGMMWSVDRSEKNRQEIVAAADELLRRTNEFVQDFLEVGKALDTVRARYDSAQTLLVDDVRGRSIAKAAGRLARLGAQPKTRSGRARELAAPIAEAVAEEAETDPNAQAAANSQS